MLWLTFSYYSVLSFINTNTIDVKISALLYYNEANKPLINPYIPNSTYVMHVVLIWIYKFIR